MTWTASEPVVRALGSISVVVDGRPVPVGGPLPRRLLAVLLASRGAMLSVDRLVEVLWGDRPPEAATSSLQTYVARLRRLLPASVRLETAAPGYRLRLEAGAADVERFEAALGKALACLADRPEAALAGLEAALGFWQGDAVRGVRWGVVGAGGGGAAGGAAPACPRGPRRGPPGVGSQRGGGERGPGGHSGPPGPGAGLADAHGWAASLRPPERSLRAAGEYRTRLRDESGLDPSSEFAALERDVAIDAPSLRAVTRAPVRIVESEGVLLGRSAELARIRRATASAKSGLPAWVLITGEAGIGKTALAEAATEAARRDGWRVAWGRCSESDAGQPLSPLVEAISELLAGAVSSGSRLGLLHSRRSAAGDGPALVQSDVAAELRDLLGDRATMLVIDDLQWADPDTVALLGYLAVHLHGPRLVVLATVRQGHYTALDQLLAVIARQGAARISAGPLSLDQAAELAQRAGVHLTTEALVKMHERSGGNPFFLTEMLKLAATNRSADLAPEAIRDVVRHRLAAQPGEVRSLLTVAAVLGDDVDIELLAAVVRLDIEGVCDLLDGAIAAGLLLSTNDAQRPWRFSHDILRESIVAELSTLHRQRLHARAADASAGLPGRPARERARHLAAAGPLAAPADVAASADAAGAEASAVGGYVDAVRWYALAAEQLDAAPGAPPAELAGAHANLAAALMRNGARQAGQDHVVTALRFALRAEDPAAASDAAGALFAGWGTWPWIDHGERPDELIRALRRAVDLTAKAGSRHHARTLNALAIATYYDDRQHSGPGALADAAVEQLDASVPIDLQIEVLAGACFSGLAPHRVRVQLSYAQRLVALCDGGEDLLLELVARYELLASQLVAGDAVGTESSYREALAVIGPPSRTSLRHDGLRVAYRRRSRPRRRRRCCPRAPRRGRREAPDQRPLRRRPRPNSRVEHVALLSGRLELLRSELPGPIAGSPLGGEHHALAALVHGDPASATAILRAHPPNSYRRDWSWLGLLSLRAELVERLGDTSQAAPLIQLLQPHQDLLPLPTAISASNRCHWLSAACSFSSVMFTVLVNPSPPCWRWLRDSGRRSGRPKRSTTSHEQSVEAPPPTTPTRTS